MVGNHVWALLYNLSINTIKIILFSLINPEKAGGKIMNCASYDFLNTMAYSLKFKKQLI